jgi:aryl-alcohol dehydrogenase-like predicted oxidoreductase
MKFRDFGAPPTALSLLGLGCSRIGSFNNPMPISQVRSLLEEALELGVTIFDTANIYGQGDSEREIGRLLSGRRTRGFVVTKLGKRFSSKMRLLRPLKPLLRPLLGMRSSKSVTGMRESNIGADFSPMRYQSELEASLRRLRFDYVDALLLHSPSAEDISDPLVGESLAGLVKAGKTRHVGVSCDDLASLEAALRLPQITMVELPVHVIALAVERSLDRQIIERKIGVLAREAIRLRPDLTPLEAVASAAAYPIVTSVVVGTSSPNNLRGLVTALG